MAATGKWVGSLLPERTATNPRSVPGLAQKAPGTNGTVIKRCNRKMLWFGATEGTTSGALPAPRQCHSGLDGFPGVTRAGIARVSLRSNPGHPSPFTLPLIIFAQNGRSDQWPGTQGPVSLAGGRVSGPPGQPAAQGFPAERLVGPRRLQGLTDRVERPLGGPFGRLKQLSS